MGHGLVVLFALCAAVFMAIGIVVRQRATIDVPSDQGVSAVMFTTLLRRPLWWAGTAAAVAGYVFQALALIKGSLIVVQPLLVSALLFALPLSARMAGRRVTRREWLWAALLTVALAVFVLLARPGPPERPASLTVAAVVAVVCAVIIVGCVVLAVKIGGWQRAALLGRRRRRAVRGRRRRDQDRHAHPGRTRRDRACWRPPRPMRWWCSAWSRRCCSSPRSTPAHSRRRCRRCWSSSPSSPSSSVPSSSVRNSTSDGYQAIALTARGRGDDRRDRRTRPRRRCLRGRARDRGGPARRLSQRSVDV